MPYINSQKDLEIFEATICIDCVHYQTNCQVLKLLQDFDLKSGSRWIIARFYILENKNTVFACKMFSAIESANFIV